MSLTAYFGGYTSAQCCRNVRKRCGSLDCRRRRASTLQTLAIVSCCLRTMPREYLHTMLLSQLLSVHWNMTGLLWCWCWSWFNFNLRQQMWHIHLLFSSLILQQKFRVLTPPGKSWKVLDFFSWKFQDLESPGKSLWSWKVLEI